MKKAVFTFLMAYCFIQVLFSQHVFTVLESGFTYSPSTVNIHVGDTVKFVGTSDHPLEQVSETTWINNGTDPLAGGFAFPTGSGKVKFNNPGTFYYVCTEHVATNGMKGKVVVTEATATDDPTKDNNLIIYPSPLSGDILSIVFQSAGQNPVDIHIIDMAGNRVLFSRAGFDDGKYTINCSGLPKGVYLIKITADETESYSKFLKL